MDPKIKVYKFNDITPTIFQNKIIYLKMVGNFHSIDPPLFDIFWSHWVPFYVHLDLINPLFLQKNRFVSITFSARDNLT